MKRLFYVRHGETEANATELLSGTIETPLTKNGINQATKVGKEIKANLPKIDLIVCSPLGRAYETAKLIAEEINYPVSKIQRNELFIERTYGTLEGTSNSHFMKPGNYHELDDVEGAETIEELQKRAVRAFDYINQFNDDNILIVAHNAFGRALKRATKNLPHTHEYEVFEQLPNATVIELV